MALNKVALVTGAARGIGLPELRNDGFKPINPATDNVNGVLGY